RPRVRRGGVAREEIDRVLEVAPHLAPERRALAPERVDARVIGRAVAVPVAYGRTRRVPDRGARRAEREVADRVGREPPDQPAAGIRRGPGGLREVAGVQHAHALIAPLRLPQPLDDPRLEHFLLVL